MSAPLPLDSKIDGVKIYASGATVTRIASLPPDWRGDRVEIAGLPLVLDDRSVRARIEGSDSAIACDIAIGLAVPSREDPGEPPLETEVRKARFKVKQLQDTLLAIQREIANLNTLEVPDRPRGEAGKSPPPSPMGARLALSHFAQEQVQAKFLEKREVAIALRTATQALADLERQQQQASSAREAQPHELRKTAIIGLSWTDRPAESPLQLVLEYFVPGARWTPSYICRLNRQDNRATIAVRASVCQRTGEDWSGVRVELSTAEPSSWCELPELASLRIGRSQPAPKPSGWRRPPVGAESLFEDYDRQKQAAKLAVSTEAIAVSPSFQAAIAPLTSLDLTSSESFAAPASKQVVDRSFTQAIDPSLSEDLEEIEELIEELDDDEMNYDSPLGAFARSPKASIEKARSAGQQRQRRSPVSMPPSPIPETVETIDRLTYSIMRLGAPEDGAERGKLKVSSPEDRYLEFLQRQDLKVPFPIRGVLNNALAEAKRCFMVHLPHGSHEVRYSAGSFDYAYAAEGRLDIPSDGQFHAIALLSRDAEVKLRYIVVPRIDPNVFRIAQLLNPLDAPLLAGMADIYVDGEYILSTEMPTIPPRGEMELGLGVEQGIQVARNTNYREVRSGETLVAFNELRHEIAIAIVNNLQRAIAIEVRDRLPVPAEGAKVDVQIDRVVPEWEVYNQQERGRPIRGGYRWKVEVPAGDRLNLEVDYTIKTFVDSELLGGNRRE
jgi:hypothetical protein